MIIKNINRIASVDTTLRLNNSLNPHAYSPNKEQQKRQQQRKRPSTDVASFSDVFTACQKKHEEKEK